MERDSKTQIWGNREKQSEREWKRYPKAEKGQTVTITLISPSFNLK